MKIVIRRKINIKGETLERKIFVGKKAYEEEDNLLALWEKEREKFKYENCGYFEEGVSTVEIHFHPILLTEWIVITY